MCRKLCRLLSQSGLQYAQLLIRISFCTSHLAIWLQYTTLSLKVL